MTTTTKRDDQWRHWLREHARAFVIADEPLWAELLTVLADSNGPEDTGPITLTSQSDRARVPSPDDVYEAAALAFTLGGNPENRHLYDTDDTAGGYAWHIDYDAHATAQERPFRAAVDSAYAAGVAAGRAQAAADVREEHERIRPASIRYCDGGLVGMATDNAYNNAAKIAGGEPRG